MSTDHLASSYSLDTMETAVSPGLRLKYTNRSGESLAYQVGFQNKQYRLLFFRNTYSYVNWPKIRHRDLTEILCLLFFDTFLFRKSKHSLRMQHSKHLECRISVKSRCHFCKNKSTSFIFFKLFLLLWFHLISWSFKITLDIILRGHLLIKGRF